MTERHTPTVRDSGPGLPAGTADTDWVSAHIFYQGDLTGLVTDAVAPLAGELTRDGLAAGWFFLRYWEGGPHLRLRVLPRNGCDGTEIRALVTERLGQYLLDHPSAEVVGQANYTRLAAVWAAQERVPSYAERMYPNNSVVFLPYRREHDRYGDGACVEAVEEHFVESSRLAVSLLAAESWATSRDTVAFCLILLTWLVGRPSDSPHHLWTGMFNSTGFGVSDVDFEERYLRQRDRLAGLTRGLDGLAAGLAGGTGAGSLAQWGRSVLRLRDALAHQAALGRFTPTHPGWGSRGDSTDSTAHGPRARVLPVLDICAHLVCNRLGISVVEESYLRYLATRAIAALAGERN